MRKKRETPLKKTRGRPKNSGLTVPAWAGKAVTELAAKSGVTAQRILEVALRDGIQLVGEPLGAWIKYGESSERLWNEHVTSTPTDHGKSTTPAPDAAFDDIELEPNDVGTTDATIDRLGDDHERPGLLEEVRTDNGSTETALGGD